MKTRACSCRISRWCFAVAAACLLSGAAPVARAQAASTNASASGLPSWITQPLSLADALDTALRQNSGLKRAAADLEASQGIVIQTRAIALPKVTAAGTYREREPRTVEAFGGEGDSDTNNPPAFPNQSWTSGVRIEQSIYEGGRVMAGLRAARLTRERSLLLYQTAVADTLLATRVAYFDAVVAEQQIVVNEASVNLLSRELEDQQRRYNAGTVPRFNVLRAEVALANARPPLIRARNAYRIAKNNLVNLLGYDLPREVWEDIPLRLTDKLAAEPWTIDLPSAISQALQNRSELGALQKAADLQRENIINARSGYKPSLQAFAGYDWASPQFREALGDPLHGWSFGAQLRWNIFDGMLTRGRVIEARALHDRAEADLEDTSRRVELEVRTAYSTFVEAREVLESQEKVQEEAAEALRLATARADAGTATQLDVLNAETALTQARTTQLQALHDYAVARARLERAIGK